MAARRRVAAAAPRSGVPSRAVSSPRVIPSIDQLMKRDAMRTLEAQYGADAARAAALREEIGRQIKVLDDTFGEMRVIVLTVADAVKVAEDLTKVFGEQGGKQGKSQV